MPLDPLSHRLGAVFKDSTFQIQQMQESIFLIVPASRIYSVLLLLRDKPEFAFQQLIDICGIDYLAQFGHFEVVYQLLSLTHNERLFIKLFIPVDACIPSVIEVYKNANWLEREAFDLYGIPFSNHPDLRRLLTDYHFDDHPLRKDFPIMGYTEVHYDPTEQKVIYREVSDLGYRKFDFLSPVQGMDDPLPPSPLPGDESK